MNANDRLEIVTSVEGLRRRVAQWRSGGAHCFRAHHGNLPKDI